MYDGDKDHLIYKCLVMSPFVSNPEKLRCSSISICYIMKSESDFISSKD